MIEDLTIERHGLVHSHMKSRVSMLVAKTWRIFDQCMVPMNTAFQRLEGGRSLWLPAGRTEARRRLRCEEEKKKNRLWLQIQDKGERAKKKKRHFQLLLPLPLPSSHDC